MTAGADTRETRESASEIKFSLDTDTADRLRERARSLLSPDPYAGGPAADEYATSTVYFDTPDFAVYRRRGSYRRAKFRVRRYGSGDLVFLERKLRTSDSLSKRRTLVGIGDLPQLASPVPSRGWAGRWFHERVVVRQLAAVCQVSYRRMARVGVTDGGPIRLTLDEQLTGTPVDRPEFPRTEGGVPLSDRTILELKFRGPMPAIFKQLVEEFRLEPQRLSKYRLGIRGVRPDVAAAVRAERAERQVTGA